MIYNIDKIHDPKEFLATLRFISANFNKALMNVKGQEDIFIVRDACKDVICELERRIGGTCNSVSVTSTVGSGTSFNINSAKINQKHSQTDSYISDYKNEKKKFELLMVKAELILRKLQSNNSDPSQHSMGQKTLRR